MIIEPVIRMDIFDALSYASRGGVEVMICGTTSPDLPLPEIAKRFEWAFALRPDIRKQVAHVIVRLDPRDPRLDLPGWVMVGNQIAATFGLQGGPLAMYLHHDIPDAEHLHVVGSMVNDIGKRVDMSGNYFRAMRIARKLEVELGLWRLPNFKGGEILPPLPRVDSPAPTLPPYPGPPLPGVVELIRVAMNTSLRPGISLPELKQSLAMMPVPVDLTVKFSAAGDKIVGLGFRSEGTWLKASEVDRTFSLSGLQKSHGVEYEPGLHIPMLAPAAPPLTGRLPAPAQIETPQLLSLLPAPGSIGLPMPVLNIPGPPAPGLLPPIQPKEVPHAPTLRSRILKVAQKIRTWFGWPLPPGPRSPGPSLRR